MRHDDARSGIESPAQAQGIAELLRVSRAGGVLETRMTDQRQVGFDHAPVERVAPW